MFWGPEGAPGRGDRRRRLPPLSELGRAEERRRASSAVGDRSCATARRERKRGERSGVEADAGGDHNEADFGQGRGRGSLRRLWGASRRAVVAPRARCDRDDEDGTRDQALSGSSRCRARAVVRPGGGVRRPRVGIHTVRSARGRRARLPLPPDCRCCARCAHAPAVPPSPMALERVPRLSAPQRRPRAGPSSAEPAILRPKAPSRSGP
jgi:hypothetical protein